MILLIELSLGEAEYPLGLTPLEGAVTGRVMSLNVQESQHLGNKCNLCLESLSSEEADISPQIRGFKKQIRTTMLHRVLIILATENLTIK